MSMTMSKNKNTENKFKWLEVKTVIFNEIEQFSIESPKTKTKTKPINITYQLHYSTNLKP